MKRFLPKLLVFIILVFLLLPPIGSVFAQGGEPAQVPGLTAQITPGGNPQLVGLSPSPVSSVPDGTWVQDREVTFTGKNAARAGHLLDWTLRSYEWSVTPEGKQNPLLTFWVMIRNIMYGLLILFVIATAFVLIVTRGRSVRAMRFIPRFIAIVLLVTLSFAIIQLIYQSTDIIQGFFLKAPEATKPCPPAPNAENTCISQKHLLYVGWQYDTFLGIRRIGEAFEESAFISLLFTKLTALTYYVMVGILLIRKIILWFFIIVSPLFPLLLLYYPVRNTAKIWIGEFFRWLMYGPLFAIFLGGLVALWRSDIPLRFDFAGRGKEIVYPTAINILLGGPKQFVNFDNSINNVETFGLYLFCLMMLWGVIIVPWILLQIFLDYAMAFNLGESPMFKQLVNYVSKPPAPTQPPSIPPPGSTGRARDLPFAKDFVIPETSKGAGLAMEIPRSTQQATPVTTPINVNVQALAQVMQQANLQVPTMRDIARYETSMISRDVTRQTEVTKLKDSLKKIGNPTQTNISTDKARFTQVKEQLTQQSNQGNIAATSILNAANMVSNTQTETQKVTQLMTALSNPATIADPAERQKYTQLKQTLTQESQQGNQFATEILQNGTKAVTDNTELEKIKQQLLEAKQKGNQTAASLLAEMSPASPATSLPQTNRIQQVSLEDYEAVKKMWTDNYRNLEVPMDGVSRSQWISDDINQVTDTINLLSSTDQSQVAAGMQKVSEILPFLLIGGFTQTEIVTYLKAKQEAAKAVVEDVKKQELEEDTLVEVQKKQEHATGHMTMSQEMPEDKPQPNDKQLDTAAESAHQEIDQLAKHEESQIAQEGTSQHDQSAGQQSQESKEEQK
jgi:hypothetical protein